MRLPIFSIEKPVFATVLNLIILLMGIVCFSLISFRYQPKVFRPGLTIRTTYLGTSAKIIESSITDPLEASLSGLPNLDTMKSYSKDGVSVIMLKFKNISKSDFLIAQSQVSRDISSVQNKLPSHATPIIHSGGMDNMVYFIAATSENMSSREISDYLKNNVQNMIEKIPGVGTVNIFGDNSALRVSFNPHKLAFYNITIPELIAKLNDNNQNIAIGEIVNDSENISINASTDVGHISKLKDLVIANKNGEPIKLSQVANISIGSQDLSGSYMLLDGHNGAGLAIKSSDDANPIAVGHEIQKTLNHLQKGFPLGLKLHVMLDMPKIMKLSLDEVGYTIIEAIILVALVTFIFLGNFRLSLIPVVTIPVCLLGSCVFLYALGYTFNIFTLLALVLAVGLVVDDAIVVLENVYRYSIKGYSSKKAAKIGSSEIGFAVVGMTICLIAVYLPVILLKGKTAVYFQQFALTLAGCVFISGFMSLTLSPVMCGLLIKNKNKNKNKNININNYHENKYQIYLDKITFKFQNCYQKILKIVLRFKLIVLVVFVSLLVFGVFLFRTLPSENMPVDQEGVAIAVLKGPSETVSSSWLVKNWIPLSKKIQNIPAVLNLTGFVGSGFGDAGSLFSFVKLSDKALLDTNFAKSSVGKINALIHKQTDLTGASFLLNLNQGTNQDSIGGALKIQLLGVTSYDQLETIAYKFKKAINNMPQIHHESISFDRNKVYKINIDRALAGKLDVPISDILQSLKASYKGQQLDNDYRFGADSYPIIVQLAKNNLKDFSSLSSVYVKSNKNKFIPLSDFVSVKKGVSRPERDHYNQQMSISFDRSVAPGYTIGQAVSAIEKVAPQFLVPGVELKFGGEARDLKKSHYELGLIFAMGIIFIYLVLAALFESFIDPFIILLTVPLCIIGALVALYLIGGSINLYTGVGLLTLIGLVSKHGVLITQFANQKVKDGLSKRDAVIQGATTRLRPIIMTSLTMILGALPLVLDHGAGSNSRSQLGWVIVSGLLIGTLFSLFVVPVAYEVLSRKSK